MVLAGMAGLEFLLAVHKVLLLLLVAGFLAVVLNPVVDAVQRRVSSRVVATAIVFTGGGLAVWVALVDLLPQIGGLLAAVPTVLFATLHSTRAGAIVLAVFLVYQQVENHVLVPLVMSRTVRLRPVWVLVSVLVGAQLLGLVGALLAVPGAAAIQIVAQDLRRQRPSSSRLAVPDS